MSCGLVKVGWGAVGLYIVERWGGLWWVGGVFNTTKLPVSFTTTQAFSFTGNLIQNQVLSYPFMEMISYKWTSTL